jgi:predicted nuclease of predicted toxin-antitoxin system
MRWLPAESARGSSDAEVIRLARDRGLVLLTEDKDFGQLVYAASEQAAGVVLIRYPAGSRAELGAAVGRFVEQLGDRLRRSFVVLEPRRIRIGSLPV